MTCEKFKQLVHEYACGETNPASAAELEGHAEICPSCGRELAQITHLDAALRRAAAGEAVDSVVDSSAVEERVRRQIATEVAAAESLAQPSTASPMPRRGRFFNAIGIAAAVALMLFAYQELSPPRDGGMLKAAAEDHQREVVEGRPRPWLRDPAAIAALAAQNGVAPQALTSLAPAGYHLDRAKRCPLGGVSFVHLVFANGTQEFSVYLGAAIPRAKLVKLAKEGESEAGIYAADFGSGHVDCIETPRLTAMVVADSSSDSTMALAKLLRSSF